MMQYRDGITIGNDLSTTQMNNPISVAGDEIEIVADEEDGSPFAAHPLHPLFKASEQGAVKISRWFIQQDERGILRDQGG